MNNLWNNLNEERKGYVAAFGLAFLFFFSIALYVLEFDHFSNTFEVRTLIIGAFIFGFLLAVVLAYRISARFSTPVEKVVITGFLILFVTGFMPLPASMVNRLLSFSQLERRPVEFFAEEAYYSNRFGRIKEQMADVSGYHLFVIHDNKLERFKMDQSRFANVEKGATISLPVRKGLLGFYFIDWED